MSLKHDITHHFGKRRQLYEVHNIEAVFKGFTDETLIEDHRAACSETSIALTYELKNQTRHMIDDMLKHESDHPETILVKRLKGGIIKPIVMDLYMPKGKKRRADRIIKRVKEIAEEYAKSTGDSLREIRVGNGKY